MHVIWKRPDGYHGADPSDFMVVELGSHSKIWLHKRDQTSYPFRIAGGWQESESTHRLNRLINLLHRDDASWVDALLKLYDDTMGDDANKFVDDLLKWVADLHGHVKGDTWELEIMNQALSEVEKRLGVNRAAFLQATKA